MSFSDRIEEHPRISAYPPQEERTGNEPLVFAVNDQLLVCTSASKAVRDYLKRERIPWKLITTLLTDIVESPNEDVEILEVELPRGETIFDVTRHIRHDVDALHGDEVSPNHVLVPAAESHSCPWGPPKPASGHLDPPPAGTISQKITVIDSGYQWFSDKWGKNPLRRYLAEPEPRPTQYIDSARPGWSQTATEDVYDSGLPFVYALAGHANFIAGVIAQHCPAARIAIRNHNGTFEPESDDFPTEAAVARSLCRSADDDPVLIDLGFAFACFDDTVSCAWGIAIGYLRSKTVGAEPLVVCPVGNQRSTVRRYPAALGMVDPATFWNVIGVGSTDPPWTWRSLFGRPFSNYGDVNSGNWVTCSANGNEVVSTFLKTRDMPVEDPPLGLSVLSNWRRPVDFGRGWASWNGTSFAAPRVVAEIAKRISQATDAAGAWEALKRDNAAASSTRLGIEFQF
jgi:thermitase